MKKTYIIPAVEVDYMEPETLIAESLLIDPTLEGDDALIREDDGLNFWDNDAIEL